MSEAHGGNTCTWGFYKNMWVGGTEPKFPKYVVVVPVPVVNNVDILIRPYSEGQCAEFVRAKSEPYRA